jgi:hypothetical protein
MNSDGHCSSLRGFAILPRVILAWHRDPDGDVASPKCVESTVDKIFVVIRSSGKSGLGVLSEAIVVPVRNKYTGALTVSPVTWCYCYVVVSVYCGAKSGASYPYGAPIPVLMR